MPTSGVYPSIILALSASTVDRLFWSADLRTVVTGLLSEICSRSLLGLRSLMPSVSTTVMVPVEVSSSAMRYKCRMFR